MVHREPEEIRIIGLRVPPAGAVPQRPLPDSKHDVPTSSIANPSEKIGYEAK